MQCVAKTAHDVSWIGVRPGVEPRADVSACPSAEPTHAHPRGSLYAARVYQVQIGAITLHIAVPGIARLVAIVMFRVYAQRLSGDESCVRFRRSRYCDTPCLLSGATLRERGRSVGRTTSSHSGISEAARYSSNLNSRA